MANEPSGEEKGESLCTLMMIVLGFWKEGGCMEVVASFVTLSWLDSSARRREPFISKVRVNYFYRRITMTDSGRYTC